MSDSSGSGLLADAMQYLLTGGAGVVGRGMYHLHLIQKGERRPWLWTVCDMLIALGIGWTVLGVSDAMGFSWKFTQSIGILAGWGGPHVMDRVIAAGIERIKGPTQEPPNKP